MYVAQTVKSHHTRYQPVGLWSLAIKTALKKLGYHNVYHIFDTWQNDDSAFWVRAMEAKWEGKGSVSDMQWDDVLAEYDVRCHIG